MWCAIHRHVYNYCTSIQQPVHGASIAPPLKQGRGRKGAAAASGLFSLSVSLSVCLSVCLSVFLRIRRRRGQIVQGVYELNFTSDCVENYRGSWFEYDCWEFGWPKNQCVLGKNCWKYSKPYRGAVSLITWPFSFALLFSLAPVASGAQFVGIELYSRLRKFLRTHLSSIEPVCNIVTYLPSFHFQFLCVWVILLSLCLISSSCPYLALLATPYIAVPISSLSRCKYNSPPSFKRFAFVKRTWVEEKTN